MNQSFQEWSLEDVLSILFGEEAKLIVQSIRGRNLDAIPKSVYENKAIKDKVIDGFSLLVENCYGGTTVEPLCFKSLSLDVKLNPLIIVRWLRDEGIFEEIFCFEPMPEGAEEKLTSLKESVAKEFDSIYLKEFSRADFWSRPEFYALLLGETYSDTFFPRLFRQFDSKLEQYISVIEKFLIVAIEKGNLVATSSAASTLLPEDYSFVDGGDRFEPLQLLTVLDSKGYPIPDDLLKSIEKGEFDKAGELLGKLRENMLHLLEHGKNPYQSPSKALPHPTTTKGKNNLIKKALKEIAPRLFKDNLEIPYVKLAEDSEVKELIRSIDPDSVISPGTLVKWLGKAAKEARIIRKVGRPRKN